MARHDKDKATGWFGGLLALIRTRNAPAAKATVAETAHRHVVDLELRHLVEFGPETPVHIVSLREYSAAIGPHWPELKGKVMFLAGTILTQLVAQGAVVTACGDYFVVAFKRPSPLRNRQSVQEISIELGQRLVGASFRMTSGGLHPAIGVAEMPAKDLLSANGEISLKALDAAIGTVKTVRTGVGSKMQEIKVAPALETKFASIEVRRPPVNANWEEMKRERVGGVARMVENKPSADKRPALVFGHQKKAWN